VRYFFEISYNGKNYNGWQTQHNGVAVQTVVEACLTKLFRAPIEIICSGRTDAGVHCEQQFFHADIEPAFDVDSMIIRLNSFLPKDIAIHSIRKVNETASARFDAIERSYRYEITRKKNPFLEDFAWHYFKSVDIITMNRAAALLIGERDFECFSKVKTNVNHFLCDIMKAEWKLWDDRLTFHITANRFLRGMVRSIVGTLLDVGSGKSSIDDVKKIIESRDRKKAGANVPPYGLYLMSVKYPPDIFIN
jgi:tRNA pseudouridine38-40 synthase